MTTIEWLRRGMAADPSYPQPQCVLIAAFALSGRDCEAKEALSPGFDTPDFSGDLEGG
jgi:hypothetical protein